ncbi:hypothetical protein HQ571_00705 [Candidatus Kuenenbacteria bacterium]|nr:hypothetical protein [Candidatus Kuenenbacteria bacterium]
MNTFGKAFQFSRSERQQRMHYRLEMSFSPLSFSTFYFVLGMLAFLFLMIGLLCFSAPVAEAQTRAKSKAKFELRIGLDRVIYDREVDAALILLHTYFEEAVLANDRAVSILMENDDLFEHCFAEVTPDEKAKALLLAKSNWSSFLEFSGNFYEQVQLKADRIEQKNYSRGKCAYPEVHKYKVILFIIETLREKANSELIKIRRDLNNLKPEEEQDEVSVVDSGMLSVCEL